MQYLLSLTAPLLLLALTRAGLRSWGFLRILGVSVLLTYLVAVGAAFATSAWYGWQHERFDRNGDGVISPAEQSPSQSLAESLVMNDAGRNLTVFFALPWSVLVSLSIFGTVALVRRARKEGALATKPAVAGARRDAYWLAAEAGTPPGCGTTTPGDSEISSTSVTPVTKWRVSPKHEPGRPTFSS